ncbi:PDZ and LIM domain protein 3-like isoform X2 [Liolophura sinensis]|uniref:PDZ and LIM domain protein 3-like isoform X1 n=1 Tax=Liolophura sinensis TaxID=3198878 RepID=UPI003158ADD3
MSNLEMRAAEHLSIRLLRNPGESWGFRLQGGVDFSTPLSIQVVQPNSVAERCGLQAGDAILKINNMPADTLAHDDAKAEIIRSGDEIHVYVARGAVKIWKPQVTPLSELRPTELRKVTTATGEEIMPMQKTSLVINKPQDEPLNIGSSHNRSAQPFGMSKQANPTLTHSQYNSPMGLYTAENIAQTYSNTARGVADQMQGLDLDDKNVGTKMSGTYQVLGEGGTEVGSSYGQQPGDNDQQQTPSPSSQNASPPPQNVSRPSQNELEPPSTESLYPVTDISPNSGVNRLGFSTNSHAQSRSFRKIQDELSEESGFRSVKAPQYDPSVKKQEKQQLMRCGGCDMLVTGVCVRASGVPYHVQCFKCTSCGMNLKQKGFFVVEGKLYCETHAKRVAQPPSENLVATAVYR